MTSGLLAVLFLPTPGTAGTGGEESQAVPSVIAGGGDFFEANDRLRDMLASNPKLGNVVSDIASQTFTVYATGDQSDRDALAAAASPETKPFGVQVRPARYAGPDIDAARDVAMLNSNHRDFIAFARARDASGLRVGFSPESEWAGMSLDELTQELGSPIPVTETFMLPPGSTRNPSGDALFDGRDNDEGALDGGSRIYMGTSFSDPLLRGCTAGVSAVLDGTSNRVMLSAAHCLRDSHPNIYVPSGEYRGWVGVRSFGRDVGYFDGRDYSSWIYDGGFGTTTRKANGSTTRPVVGEGENVCMSGASSGSLCEVRILEVGVSVTVDGDTFHDMTLGRRFLHGGAGGEGDSGAPLIRRTYDISEGRTVARPMGLLTGPLDRAETSETDCNGVAPVCNDYIYFSGLREAELAMNFTVVNP